MGNYFVNWPQKRKLPSDGSLVKKKTNPKYSLFMYFIKLINLSNSCPGGFSSSMNAPIMQA